MSGTINRREFLRLGGRLSLGLGLLPGAAALLQGCAEMGELSAIGAQIAQSSNLISEDQAQSIARSGQAVGRSFEEITPAQEYYIGRSIGAVILEKYPAYRAPDANRYLNLLGQTLATASEKPNTYGGYHFLILDSDDINALSAPGGHIFITRGLLRCCTHEDAAAAVLAHEIGHVQRQHGLRAIKTARLTNALTILGAESAKQFGGAELASLTKTFEGALNDIAQTLINSGYARSLEYEADADAAAILKRLGYNPNGLVDMLRVMDRRLKPGGLDFAKTHPAPEDRIRRVQKILDAYQPVRVPGARQRRFESAMRRV
ncbi:MAG: M48 family metalloprotease [Desulfococcaceae bacterium]